MCWVISCRAAVAQAALCVANNSCAARSVADREKALSRSLRIFGVTFQGRACPTVDEYTKRVLFVGGLPPNATQHVRTSHFSAL